MHVPVATTHVVGGSAIAGSGSVGSADAGDGGGAIGGLGAMLLVVGSELAGGVARVEGVVAMVVDFSIAVVGVRNASRTPDITTAAAAPTNAIAARRRRSCVRGWRGTRKSRRPPVHSLTCDLTGSRRPSPDRCAGRNHPGRLLLRQGVLWRITLLSLSPLVAGSSPSPYRENSVDPSAGNGRIYGFGQVAFLGPAVAAGVAARGEAVRRGQRFAVEQYADRVTVQP